MSWQVPPAWRGRLIAPAPAPRDPNRTLGPRLASLADRAILGAPVADVCADHALLAMHLVATTRVPRATAVDVAADPVRDARARVEAAGMTDCVDVVQGDGLTPLPAGFGGTVIVAGVGGRLVAGLLDAVEIARVAPRRLVLQPNSDEAVVRDHLWSIGWRIVDEVLVVEAGRIFLTMVTEPGVGPPLDAVDRYVGPVLRHAKTPALAAWIEVQRAWLAPRVAALERASDPASEAAKARLNAIETVGARFE